MGRKVGQDAGQPRRRAPFFETRATPGPHPGPLESGWRKAKCRRQEGQLGESCPTYNTRFPAGLGGPEDFHILPTDSVTKWFCFW